MSAEEEFVQAYSSARVDAQKQWYESRMNEYESADRQAASMRHGALAAATVCGALGAIGLGSSEYWGLSAAVLAAFATLITAWSDVIGFKMNSAIYEAATAGIDGLRSKRPVPPITAEKNISYVREVEGVLSGEVTGWAERWGEAIKPEPKDD